jgi:hypothetical protein
MAWPEACGHAGARHVAGLQRLATALTKLSVEQHEALLLVSAEGAYEKAAQIYSTSIGAIRSRVNRASTGLAKPRLLIQKMTLGTAALSKLICRCTRHLDQGSIAAASPDGMAEIALERGH